jgi:hypothetical protein
VTGTGGTRGGGADADGSRGDQRRGPVELRSGRRRRLPDDSVDMLFTSPPYLHARTYGIDAGRDLDEWVRWMVDLVTAASPKVKGLIAINCEGQTAGFSYKPSPFVLVADLHRAGFTLRKPVVYQRYGIPGGGGTDWLRNDWEPIVCVTRGGRLPWSDPTACGHPPKWKPGGEMSNRLADGKRANAGKSARAVAREVGYEMRTTSSGVDDAGTKTVATYIPPDIANPGNVVNCGAVGGGRIGSALAHHNEAPFPLQLAEFFVRSFCPPGGIVLDCFSGSGTTCHAAIEHGRRFVGCDARPSQVAICGRRVRTITPSFLEVSAQ